jgi:glutaminyl-peptide cyclotransferase
MASTNPATPKLLIWALGIQLVIGGLLVWQASTGFALFRSDDGAPTAPLTAAPAPAGGAAAATPTPTATTAADEASTVPVPTVDRFDAAAAMSWAQRQVDLGPRPAGSAAERAAAEFLRPALPGGRFVAIPDGLRNVQGRLRGRGKEILLIAHYDTTPVDGYVGANNSAAAVGAVIELAKALKRDQRPTDRPIRFLLSDGEEAPTYPVQGDFIAQGLRGSRAAAAAPPAGGTAAVVVLDFVGQANLEIPREASSTPTLWNRLRSAAAAVGVGSVFPDRARGVIQDDHTPFLQRGIPAIDLIDFDYPCWQKPCDTMDKLSVRSLDAAGEAVLQLVRTLRRTP